MAAVTDSPRTPPADAQQPGAPRGLAAARIAINGLARVAPPLSGLAALQLWRRPPGRVPVRTAERAVMARSRVSSVSHAGRDVVSYDWGDGVRPVLLVHGWGSRASRYAAVVQRLLDVGYSPVTYDAPGHGATPGRAGTILDHEQIIRALERRHGRFAGVVAHSLGVPFALYAAREGVAVDRVVAISGVCDFGHLVDSVCAVLRLHPAVNAPLRRAIERAYFDGDDGIWSRFSAERPAACDLLVVHDLADDVVDPHQAELLAVAYGTRASRLQTEGLGHNAILRDADVIRSVVAFLDEAPA
jgi:pimeloyl-ACP methyl ester carboxylesterase